MMLDLEAVIKLAAPFLTAIIDVVRRKYFQNKAKIIAYYGHFSHHRFKNINLENGKPSIDIYTHSVFIRNVGKLTAINVRLGHLSLPEYNIAPIVKHEISELPEGGKEI